MNMAEYKQRVIALFKSRQVTDAQYQEMASAVAGASEDHDAVPMIDSAVGVDDEEK